jgi:DNA polymerase-3 subunit epsilon
MDVEEEVAVAGEELAVVPLAQVIFQRASEDELAAHQETLAGLDKAVKGQCIWTALTTPPAPVA